MINNNKFSKVGIWARYQIQLLVGQLSGVMIGGIEGCVVYKNRL